ncbi:MAG: Arc family DNA-binding protein [Endozoicomonas sp.]
MSRDWPTFILRIPQPLRDRLNQAARKNHRSLNSEILYRCEQFDLQRPASQDDIQALLQRLDQLEALIAKTPDTSE